MLYLERWAWGIKYKTKRGGRKLSQLLLRHHPGICLAGLRKIVKISQSGQLVSQPRFKPWTS
jgi:hypothetical protein